ncbi:hypothetical protein [Corallococcus carmarthensis]|uniref:Uncharacterized protein n=1 Tax=Corallococcus carmarthensis TaxID=2316728 RepID=A0A3A8K7P6_9BACT|nr:hypothetical protein [Corallococcus carmarthensis]RKG97793.1 hypothetical protein D7X32_31525 [Corallococcus carmarthensis]
MKIEFEKPPKEYSPAEIAEIVLKMWPATAPPPPLEDVLGCVKSLAAENATVNLVTLAAAVECIIRTHYGDFYTDWEQLLCATRALPMLSTHEKYKKLVDDSWAKFKGTNTELDEAETDALAEAVLKPSPKLAWAESTFRYVSTKVDEKYVIPCIKLTKWKSEKGKLKQEAMLSEHQGRRNPPPPLTIARVERVGGLELSPQHIDYKLRVLQFVFESGFLGGLKRTNYQAPFGSKPKPFILQDPWSLMQLRNLSKRTRTWVDDLLERVNLKDAVDRARTVHLTIAKGRMLMVDCWSNIVAVIKALKEAYPSEGHAYVCLGGSPAPIMIAMEHLDPTSQIFHLPVSGIKGGVEYWLGQVDTIWERYADAISVHFSKYLPPLGGIRGNKLVIVDYTSTGTALAVGIVLVRKYYARLVSTSKSTEVVAPKVFGFALCTNFHPNPKLLEGTVLHNLGKNELGIALEKQTLKGTGLRGLAKMEIASLQTTPENVPETQLDVAGLMRMLAQIQLKMTPKQLK